MFEICTIIVSVLIEQGVFVMTQENFNRFNHLSDKVLNQTATIHELKEFSSLLKAWNQSAEFNIVNRVHMHKISQELDH